MSQYMPLDQFIDQTKTAVRRSLIKAGKTEPTPEEAAEHGRWLAALIDAEEMGEVNSRKDWAHLLLEGIPPIPSVEEWASAKYEQCTDEMDPEAAHDNLTELLTRLDAL